MPKKLNEKWTTPPPPIRKHETMIKMKNQDNSKEVMKEIKQNIAKSEKSTGSFKNIKKLENGSIIIQCENEIQQQKLREILENNSEIELKEIQNTDPMIMITGIEKGYKFKELIQIILEENPELKIFGNSNKTLFKFITKKDCLNKRKENWILQTKPEIFRWFMKKEKINFDLTKTYVKEYCNIAMC